MPLILTYDNVSMQDGLGSQALRLLGVYSIAKLVRVPYLHSPITSFVEEYAHSLENSDDQLSLLKKVNAFFLFPSTIADMSNAIHLTKREIGLRGLLYMKLRFLLSRRMVVLHLLLPFKITDRLPWVYTFGARYLKRKNRRLLNYKNEVVVHIRSGYGYLCTDLSELRRRQLPFGYYNAVISAVSKKLVPDEIFKLIVHTDLSPVDTTWRPIQESILSDAKRVSGIDVDSEALHLPGVDLREKITIPKNATAQFKYCADFMETFLDMCNCQILIQSKSSFSYLAGLMNKGVVIWPIYHGHSRYPSWKSSLRLGLKKDLFQPLFEGPPAKS
jgi:hypothetical protein